MNSTDLTDFKTNIPWYFVTFQCNYIIKLMRLIVFFVTVVWIHRYACGLSFKFMTPLLVLERPLMYFLLYVVGNKFCTTSASSGVQRTNLKNQNTEKLLTQPTVLQFYLGDIVLVNFVFYWVFKYESKGLLRHREFIE